MSDNKIYIRTDKNGTKIFHDHTCQRCGGTGGADKWSFTGWTCYECGGSGRSEKYDVIKEYTPEYKAKLDARREARWKAQEDQRQAQEEKERAEREAKEKAEREAQKAKEERIRAEKAISQYVGEIGERLDLTVEYIGSGSWEQKSFTGFGTETMYIHLFKDQNGNKIGWKTSTNKMGRFDPVTDEWIPFEEGTKLQIRGTIKEHSEYKDEKQTLLTRCKIERI